MLYLEDYLEMIEHLPQELRDRFTEMREMDLQVQNSMDSLEKQVKLFFSRAKKLKPQEREDEHAAILKDYYKTLEDADEKVQMASQIYELVDRYLRRLDQELHKFKMELEADNKGITELLEKRSLELDQPAANSSQKENRYSLGMTRTQGEKRQAAGAPQALVEKKVALERLPGSQTPVSEPRPSSTSMALVPATPVSFSLSHIAGSTAIAAAASQAIAATQQMQQGRRTASLKASYEAINTGVHPHELSIGRELAGAAQSAIAAAILPETTKKQKKRGGGSSSSVASPLQPSASSASSVPPSLLSATLPVVPSPPAIPPVEESAPYDASIDPNVDNPDWTYDPNEPRYCICNQVSYGDMVACDNEDCPFEWFHYPCVNITAPPKGKWYCPQCTTNMKRRGSRK